MSSRLPAARGEKRRSEILKAALSLFNARGTAAVSTNHIASDLGISVGNLYWHFGDKDAIVRALYEEQVGRFDEVWQPPMSATGSADIVVAALHRTFTISWAYRFFYRELPSLTRSDPALRKIYVEQRNRRRGELRAFQRSFVELGVLQIPGGEPVLAQLEELSWMISTFWLAHVELREGALTKQGALTGARAVLDLYVPYAAPEWSHELSVALARSDEGT